eukprot:c11972_g1_i1.p1 GENE.c11972_g1_i1~~c11972_g1_i1.p1  ORF type:complete len:128 (+),score=8.78 c11972_g1_i1:1-384(+)
MGALLFCVMRNKSSTVIDTVLSMDLLMNKLKDENDIVEIENILIRLNDLSGVNENKIELVTKHNIVPVLFQLLKNGDNKIKENASINIENQREFVKQLSTFGFITTLLILVIAVVVHFYFYYLIFNF